MVAALVNPAWRGLAFVAGSPYAAAIATWRDTVESLLDDTEGIANAWVLSPSATDRFNYLVQPTHQVSGGVVRTFLPGVDIGNALDAERHRYLTRRSLERKPSNALRRLFGQRAREQMIATRLPDVLCDMDRILRQDIDSELLDGLTAAPRDPAPAVRPQPVPPPRPPEVLDETERATQVAEPEVVEPELPEPQPQPVAKPVPAVLGQYLATVLHAVLGTEEITLENLSLLEVLTRTGLRADATKQRISARLRELQTASTTWVSSATSPARNSPSSSASEPTPRTNAPRQNVICDTCASSWSSRGAGRSPGPNPNSMSATSVPTPSSICSNASPSWST